jgi:Tfp pilus assembly protein PilP
MVFVWFFLFSTASASAAAAPVSEVGDVFNDNILKMRDPFKRPDVETAKAIAREELENYGLDSLKLVGVMTGPRLRALLLANDGKTFVVRTGKKIGQRGGVVLKITPEKIVVREKIANVLGKTENLDSELVLQSEKGGGGGKPR